MGLKAALIFAGCVFPTMTFADWNYVRWGMSPDQVVEASKGEAQKHSGDGGDIMCASTGQSVIAYVAVKKIDAFTFEVVICSDAPGGKATSVVLTPRPFQDSYTPLRTALLARYGEPVQDGNGDLATTIWQDCKGGNLVKLQRVIDSGRLEYRPAASGL